LSLPLSVGLAWTINLAAQSEPTSAGREQAAPVALRVTLRDPTGAPIAGARATAAQAGTAAPDATVSDARGTLAFAVRPRVTLTITIEAAGFEPLSDTVAVPSDGPISREYALQIAGVTESVTVAAPAPAYRPGTITSGTKTAADARDVPQAITVVTQPFMKDRMMSNIADVVRYVPGVIAHQGENNRDQIIMRGNSSSADFFLNGVRDDVQYYRDLYNVERVEALKGPNAMIFGRGGGGGVINRVTKEAAFAPVTEVVVQGGSFGDRRFTGDLGRVLSPHVAGRLNAVYEQSDSFRQGVSLERYGVNPTFTVTPDANTMVTVGYEYLHDWRIADRGIPSFQGLPADIDPSTYFGDPRRSHVDADIHLASTAIGRHFGAVSVHNRTLFGDYVRGYQNFVPGAVSADQTQVALSAYNNRTDRVNVFNQTDLVWAASTGRVRHTILAGAEIGRQATANLRNTGYFDDRATSTWVPYDNPSTDLPVTFRPSATDADNRVRTRVAAAYAQDQVELLPAVQVIAGIRVDDFDLEFHNNRTGEDLGRVDRLASPRAALIVKPVQPLSLYGSYTVSSLPSSGDQFSSLTSVTEQLAPERFHNYELGAKWDIAPGLLLTTALYRLDRTNTRATDPEDPARIVQTGGQRTNGLEVGLNGRLTAAWQVVAGYARQNAFVTSATTAARAGAEVAQVPHHTASIWNQIQVRPRVALGVGLVRRTDMYAAIDDVVVLPGYTDIDAALSITPTPALRLQVNVENLWNRTYVVNADSNTNISPGSPRTVRVALTTRF
jgi:catecholate siderophore receptor